MIYHRRFFKRLKLLWGEVELHFKSVSISTDNGRTSTLSSFYCISNHKNFILKVSITFLQISLKLHYYRDGYWTKKPSSTILEEELPEPGNTTANKIVDGAISLL